MDRNEAIIELFQDYLEEDQKVQVILTRWGYAVLYCEPSGEVGMDAQLCETPEELFDELLGLCETYHEVRLTEGRHDKTAEDQRKIDTIKEGYFKKWEALR